MSGNGPQPRFCRVAKRFLYIVIAEWFFFIAIVMIAGGSALSGKIEGGQHFFQNRGHYTPVPEAIFTLMGVFERGSICSFCAVWRHLP